MSSDCNAPWYAEASLASDAVEEGVAEAVDAVSDDSIADRIAVNEADAEVDELTGFESVKSKSACCS